MRFFRLIDRFEIDFRAERSEIFLAIRSSCQEHGRAAAGEGATARHGCGEAPYPCEVRAVRTEGDENEPQGVFVPESR